MPRPKLTDLKAAIAAKDAEIERLERQNKNIDEYAQVCKAELIDAWREGYKAGRENVEAQNVPMMALERDRAAERGYQQAATDLAWKPSASDYL